MKRFLILLLAVAVMAAATGCQHISDAYTKKEEQQLKDAGRAAVAAWLAETIPGAELGEEKDTYCDIVTDYSKFYLSGYVQVPYRVGSETHEVLVEPVSGRIYSEEDTGALRELIEDRVIRALGFAREDVLEADFEVCYNIPVVYPATQDIGKFPYLNATDYLPVVPEGELSGWLDRTQERETIDVSGAIRTAEGTDLSAFCGEAIDRIEQENGLSIFWLQAFDDSLSEVATRRDDGTVTHVFYALGEIGAYCAEYLAAAVEEEPLGNGSYQVSRDEFVFSDCVRLEQQGDGMVFRIDAGDERFNINLTARELLPEMSRSWSRKWKDGDTESLQWIEQEDGAYLLADAAGDEVRFWDECSAVVS